MKSKQHLDQPLKELNKFILGKLNESFSLGEDNVLRDQGKLCFPDADGLRDRILKEPHGSCYFIHPSSMKLYHDLRDIHWWEGLKKDIAEFVAKCPNCQQVKAEHQKLSDLLLEIQIPTWNWEDINMDLVVGFTLDSDMGCCE